MHLVFVQTGLHQFVVFKQVRDCEIVLVVSGINTAQLEVHLVVILKPLVSVALFNQQLSDLFQLILLSSQTFSALIWNFLEGFVLVDCALMTFGFVLLMGLHPHNCQLQICCCLIVLTLTFDPSALACKCLGSAKGLRTGALLLLVITFFMLASFLPVVACFVRHPAVVFGVITFSEICKFAGDDLESFHFWCHARRVHSSLVLG